RLRQLDGRSSAPFSTEATRRTAQHVVPATVDLCPLHAAGPESRVEVTRERVGGLVVVIVGIEDGGLGVLHAPGVERVLVSSTGPRPVTVRAGSHRPDET